VCRDDVVEGRPRGTDKITDLFGIAFVSESCEAAEIRKENGYLFAFARWTGMVRKSGSRARRFDRFATVRTEPRTRRQFTVAMDAGSRQGHAAFWTGSEPGRDLGAARGAEHDGIVMTNDGRRNLKEGQSGGAWEGRRQAGSITIARTR